MDTTDSLYQQLRRMREGRGLTVERLAHSPDLLAALGSTEATEALQALHVILDRFGDVDRFRALKVDLGLDLDLLLERPAIGRELDWLGERRTGFGHVIGRDPKTLGRWSDRAIAELCAHLVKQRFTGQLVVAAGVQNRRLAGIEVLQFDHDDDSLSHGTNTGYTNPEAGASLPLVLYGFPREWQPTAIRFVVTFIDEAPRVVWALVADNVLDVGFGHERTELEIIDTMVRCRVEQPRFDQLYGVWWEWN